MKCFNLLFSFLCFIILSLPTQQVNANNSNAGYWYRCIQNITPGRMRVQSCIQNGDVKCYEDEKSKRPKKNKESWKRSKLEKGSFEKFYIKGFQFDLPKLFVISSGKVFTPSLKFTTRKGIDDSKCRNSAFQFRYGRQGLYGRGY